MSSHLDKLPAIIELLEQEAPGSLMPYLRQRHMLGMKKYGQPLKPFGGNDPIVYAFEEFLDGIFYTRQALAERNRFVTWLFYKLLVLLTTAYYHQHKSRLDIWCASKLDKYYQHDVE
jgi:hypothetical protein